VLGACLLSREALAAVAGFLDPAHFAEELHRRIFAAMRERLGEGALATLVTLGRSWAIWTCPKGGGARLPRPPGGVGAQHRQRARLCPPDRRSRAPARDHARRAGRARRRGVAGIGGPTQAIAADAIDGLNEIVAAGAERRRRPLSEAPATFSRTRKKSEREQ